MTKNFRAHGQPGRASIIYRNGQPVIVIQLPDGTFVPPNTKATRAFRHLNRLARQAERKLQAEQQKEQEDAAPQARQCNSTGHRHYAAV